MSLPQRWKNICRTNNSTRRRDSHPPFLRHAWRGLWVAWGLVFLVACSFPGSVKPTVKIGLSAPFEGRYRDLGYEVLHAVRLAVRQRNDAGGVGERYLVEFVALNDFNEPVSAIVQARKMAVDAKVLGVLGGWSPETAAAVEPVYERLQVAFLSPAVDFREFQESPPVSAAFAADYQTISGGAQPGPAAVWAYDEANRLLDTLDAAVREKGRPTRIDIWAAVVTSD
jgi:ABC-type branched-subunit amino acid transport system substrate-binding protein